MGDSEIVAAATNGATAPADSKAAEKMTPEAMFNLAELLRKGEGDTKKDLSRAVELYQLALEQGYVKARDPLMEVLSQTPSAKPEDLQAAKEILGMGGDGEEGEEDAEMAASSKLVEQAGELEESEPAKAVALYTTAIEEFDDTDAMNSLAIMLEAGADGVPVNAKRAVELYTRAAEAEHYEAAFNLAVLLVKGADGVPKDAPRAVKLYESVIAEEADTDAMRNLAVLLQTGAEGVPQDTTRAEKLLEEAQMFATAPMEDDDDVGDTDDADMAKDDVDKKA